LVTTLLQPSAVALEATVAHGARVLVRDGTIVQVGTFAADADQTLELDGTLVPGPIDLQVNGAAGRGVDEATGEALDEVARAVFEGGATAFLPTLISAPFEQLLGQIRAVAAWIARGGHRFAFLATAGAHLETYFADPTPDRVDAVLEAARGHLALLTLAPARPGAEAAIERLRARGVQVALGHSGIGTYHRCVAAGARLVTHLFNAMGPIHHRDVGLGGFALDDARVACSLIVDGQHLHPVWVRNAWRCLGPERTVLVTDSAAAAGMPDGEYRLGGQPVRLQAGVVLDAQGRLAGSALTMRAAVGWRTGWRSCPAAARGRSRGSPRPTRRACSPTHGAGASRRVASPSSACSRPTAPSARSGSKGQSVTSVWPSAPTVAGTTQRRRCRWHVASLPWQVR
jgi:N-acetylglucosamine-6-phosphate deacetylase